MKYQRPMIVFQCPGLRLIQGGVKDFPLLFDFLFVASLTAYEADE